MITFGLGGLALITMGLGKMLAYFSQEIPRIPRAKVTFEDTTQETFMVDKQTEIRETSPIRKIRKTSAFVEIK